MCNPSDGQPGAGHGVRIIVVQHVGTKTPQRPTDLPKGCGRSSAAGESDRFNAFRRHPCGELAAAPGENDATTSALPQTGGQQPRLLLATVPTALCRDQSDCQLGA